MRQLSLFDYEQEIKDPPCYTCVHALKRGRFRLCHKGHVGYRTIGKHVLCDDHEEPAED